MKTSHLILISILLCGLLVVPVSADAFSAWSAYGDSWKSTNDTYTRIMWNQTGSHTFVTTGNATTVSYLVVGGGGGGGSDVSDFGSGGGGAAGSEVIFELQRITSAATETSSDGRYLDGSVKYTRTLAA